MFDFKFHVVLLKKKNFRNYKINHKYYRKKPDCIQPGIEHARLLLQNLIHVIIFVHLYLLFESTLFKHIVISLSAFVKEKLKKKIFLDKIIISRYSVDTMEILPIKKEEVKPWVLFKHYARRMPPISYAFGLYNSEELIGVVTFGKPASNSLCKGVCGEGFSHLVFELNRLCLEGNKKNHASILISGAFKRLPKPLIIVSYADTSKNHVGYVYQATNWIYTGLTTKRTEKFDPYNPNRHSKTATLQNKKKYAQLPIRDRPQKHRYIYFLGSKTQKKQMVRALRYPRLEYPKGDSERYDASIKVSTQLNMFGEVGD